MISKFKWGLLVLILILGLVYIYNQIEDFKVRELAIPSDKISNEVRFSQISDFHSNKFIDLDRLKDEIEDFDPNFIVLTGDIIDRKDDDFTVAISLLDTLKSLEIEIYYIIGNHEDENIYFKDFKSEIQSRNITVLEDSHSIIDVEGNTVNIIGMRHNSFMGSELSMNMNKYEEIVGGLDRNNFNLLLVHSPTYVHETVLGHEDLVLSGHTHGGQIRLPIIGPIVVPGQGLFPEYDKGLFELENGHIYIDSGLGNSFLPIRTLNHVQFTNFILH